MESLKTSPATSETQDEREWELTDEELDRAGQTATSRDCSTSRPCVCQICSSPSHCR